MTTKETEVRILLSKMYDETRLMITKEKDITLNRYATDIVKLFSIHGVSNWVDCDSLPEHLEKVLVFGKIEPWSENELHTAILNKAGGLNHWYTGGMRMHEVSKWKRIIAPPCY